MSTITSHVVDGETGGITIEADERDAENGNASHTYRLLYDPDNKQVQTVNFQQGPVKQAGVNGVTNEALLAIVLDRLEGFQAGAFACEENELAVTAIKVALEILQLRTRRRIARGVEGSNVL